MTAEPTFPSADPPIAAAPRVSQSSLSLYIVSTGQLLTQSQHISDLGRLAAYDTACREAPDRGCCYLIPECVLHTGTQAVPRPLQLYPQLGGTQQVCSLLCAGIMVQPLSNDVGSCHPIGVYMGSSIAARMRHRTICTRDSLLVIPVWRSCRRDALDSSVRPVRHAACRLQPAVTGWAVLVGPLSPRHRRLASSR